ncbi:hypothetical protein NQ317_009237 [Molorchus minor]|uniref:Phosphoribulokinase/uridine kinase domain-containing protein n=1 Tax=Molorchus minor TaxID=1323400 RepID=A0ABQ9J3V9_9CUCU|nr:hypothetical protein NQ317_009237 [Molorchus minor]
MIIKILNRLLTDKFYKKSGSVLFTVKLPYLKMSQKNILIIGICGVTCGGKTTLATELNHILPSSKIFSQDDYYLDVSDCRHTFIPELNHINFDVLTSLDMERMHQDILKFISNNNLKPVGTKKKINLINGTGIKDLRKYVHDRVKKSELNVLIIEGFSILNYKPLLNLFNLKYYFTLSLEECKKRRDTRVYEPPDCPGYFEKCAWPEHLKQLDEVKMTITDVTYFTEHSRDIVEQILVDIVNYS